MEFVTGEEAVECCFVSELAYASKIFVTLGLISNVATERVDGPFKGYVEASFVWYAVVVEEIPDVA